MPNFPRVENISAERNKYKKSKLSEERDTLVKIADLHVLLNLSAAAACYELYR